MPGRAATRRAGIVATVANIAGLACGPLIAGLLARDEAHGLTLPFQVFLAALVLAGLAVVLAPEGHPPIDPRPRYRPQRLSVSPQARRQFTAAAAGVFLCLAVLGLYAGLAGMFRAPAPDAACRGCGTVTRLAGAGLCPRCYDRSPHRVTMRAGNLAARLDDPPAWLPGFTEYLASRHHAGRACQMITLLGRLLADGGPARPQALAERAAMVSVPLARALEDFLTGHGLALPPGHEEDAAARRRRRRLAAIPVPLRPAAEAFAEHELNGRIRARTAGTRPRQHATIESHLTTIRDLAIFLTGTTPVTDWATVSATETEAFLATQPARAAHRLAALRRFFGFATRRRLVLASPVAGITIRQPPASAARR